jgi:hypothetical protein
MMGDNSVIEPKAAAAARAADPDGRSSVTPPDHAVAPATLEAALFVASAVVLDRPFG